MLKLIIEEDVCALLKNVVLSIAVWDKLCFLNMHNNDSLAGGEGLSIMFKLSRILQGKETFKNVNRPRA